MAQMPMNADDSVNAGSVNRPVPVDLRPDPDMLTPAELECLRQKAREADEYGRQVFGDARKAVELCLVDSLSPRAA